MSFNPQGGQLAPPPLYAPLLIDNSQGHLRLSPCWQRWFSDLAYRLQELEQEARARSKDGLFR